MKSFCAFLLAATLCLPLVGGGAWAGMNGHPGTLPKPGRFEVGVQGMWFYSQDFKDFNADVSRGAAHYSVAAKDAHITDDHCFMASIAYGVSNRFSLFAKLGIRDGGRFHFSSWDAESGTWWSSKFKLKSVLAWTLGARARVFESPDGLGVALSAQYQRYDDRKSGNMEYQGSNISLNDFQANYWQADVAAGVYKKLDRLTLFAGLGYEHAELSIAGHANQGTTYANHIDFGDMKNQDSLSLFLGLSWRVTGHLNLTLQGDFIAHDAVAMGVSCAF